MCVERAGARGGDSPTEVALRPDPSATPPSPNVGVLDLLTAALLLHFRLAAATSEEASVRQVHHVKGHQSTAGIQSASSASATAEAEVQEAPRVGGCVWRRIDVTLLRGRSSASDWRHTAAAPRPFWTQIDHVCATTPAFSVWQCTPATEEPVLVRRLSGARESG